MVMIAWPFVRMLGLRVASVAMAGLMSPFWRGVAAVAVIALAFTAWSAWQRGIGRDQEREAAALVSAEAEARALKVHNEIIAERTAQEDADRRALAEKAAQEQGVRDANTGDDVLWRADDGWLRSKRAAKGGR